MNSYNEYNPEELFSLEEDEILLKEKNSVNHIYYNETRKHGELQKKNTPFVTFPALEKYDFIRHGFSTKLGGVSKNEFTSLNLSFYRGDEEASVATNYDRILKSMGLEETKVIFSDQVHDTIVHHVTKEDIPTKKYERILKGIDGLITNEPGLTLCTSYADCVPLYFVDPVKKAIGLSHSGWKGTVGKIGAKTVKAMCETFGSKESDIIAVIGPSICFDCYEISEDVAKQFMKAFREEDHDKILWYKGNGKYHLDLWLANELILQEAGVKKENISNSNICTCCNSTLFYSHRASQGKRGNLAAFLALVP
ncbi:hypothetical protein lbkm_0894 [Lachnospiraceae bacterium KM106-2]|nr:hypothetical protein lbkm_0894 [Lachnospiraceae bacterium KM106-2]